MGSFIFFLDKRLNDMFPAVDKVESVSNVLSINCSILYSS